MKGHEVKREVWVIDIIENLGQDIERTYRSEQIFYCKEDAEEVIEQWKKEDLIEQENEDYENNDVIYDCSSVEMSFWEL